MNYELVRQLKDAGFPQNTSQWILYTIDSPSAEANSKVYHALREEDLGLVEINEILADPTLSELIEACGDQFLELSRHNEKEWISTRLYNKKVYFLKDSSAEGAVAKLWLVINKK